MPKIKRSFVELLAVFLLSLLLFGCTTEKQLTLPEKYSKTIYDAFDTEITLSAYCKNQEEFNTYAKVFEDEFIKYHKFFDIYYTYPDMNNLRTVNISAGMEPVKIDSEIIELLNFSKDIYYLTEGKTNVAMGSVLSIWHTSREYNNAVPYELCMLPEYNILKEAANHCKIEDIEIKENNSTVFLRDKKMSIDVGSVAKGFATERVVQTLSEMGLKAFSVNAGGNVRCFGTKPDGSSWNIAVTDPRKIGYLCTVPIKDGSLVTSGVYQRFFTIDGKRYHHIIDPETLYPEDKYLSVTVQTENSALADGLSTALFNMELEEGKLFVENLADVEALWVTNSGETIFSSGFVANY